MPKKNTLLYLDEDLVRMAKVSNLNISKLAESAIRSQLMTKMSERALDFESHIRDLKDDGQCYFLPFTIEEVKIRDVGPIGRLDFSFSSGINIITGSNGTGKSILIRAIASAFGLYEPRGPLLRHGAEEGSVDVQVQESKDVFVKYSKADVRPGECNEETCIRSILLDEPLAWLAPEQKRKLIGWVRKKYNCQVIVATRLLSDLKLPEAKFIHLESIRSRVKKLEKRKAKLCDKIFDINLKLEEIKGKPRQLEVKKRLEVELNHYESELESISKALSRESKGL